MSAFENDGFMRNMDGSSFAWRRVMESLSRQDFTFTGDHERGTK